MEFRCKLERRATDSWLLSTLRSTSCQPLFLYSFLVAGTNPRAHTRRRCRRQVWSGVRKWTRLRETAGQEKILRWHGKSGKWVYGFCLLAVVLGVQSPASGFGWAFSMSLSVALVALGGMVIFSVPSPALSTGHGANSAVGIEETVPLV